MKAARLIVKLCTSLAPAPARSVHGVGFLKINSVGYKRTRHITNCAV